MNNLYPAVKAIIQQDEKFLIIKQELPNNAVWVLPGGRIDYGENPYETLKREVMEETRLSIEIIKPLGLYWFFRQDGNQVICTTFLCKIDKNAVDISKNLSDEDISEYRWVTKDEFLSAEYHVDHESLKQLFALL